MSHKPRAPLHFHGDLMQRVFMTGDTSPGNWNFAADIVRICANHMDGWTKRFEDASRIPDVLGEAASALWREAVEQAERNRVSEERFDADDT